MVHKLSEKQGSKSKY